jgi:hypothetical protein
MDNSKDSFDTGHAMRASMQRLARDLRRRSKVSASSSDGRYSIGCSSTDKSNSSLLTGERTHANHSTDKVVQSTIRQSFAETSSLFSSGLFTKKEQDAGKKTGQLSSASFRRISIDVEAEKYQQSPVRAARVSCSEAQTTSKGRRSDAGKEIEKDNVRRRTSSGITHNGAFQIQHQPCSSKELTDLNGVSQLLKKSLRRRTFEHANRPPASASFPLRPDLQVMLCF